jgi:hypothetical protein
MTSIADSEAIILEAYRCLSRGWVPVPVVLGDKKPALDAWQHVRPSQADLKPLFATSSLGVLLGEPSKNLVDADLDCPEAEFLANWLLPPTACRFGRNGRETHRLYYAKVDKPIKRLTKTSGVLVELRSNGQQTVLPPSIHVDDETRQQGPRHWTAQGEPAVVDADNLAARVDLLAAASLLAQGLRADGIRHDAALALAGGLFRSGWDEGDVRTFVFRICEAAGHRDLADRLNGVDSTIAAIKNKQKATGWRRLSELLGDEIVQKASEWLKVDSGHGVGIGDVSSWTCVRIGKDPPEFRICLADGVYITVPPDTLVNPQAMKIAMINQIGKAPVMPNRRIYDRAIAAMTDNCDVETRPSDVERCFALVEIVDTWIVRSQPGSVDELAERRTLILHEDEEVTRIEVVKQILTEAGEDVTRQDVSEILRALDFHPRVSKLCGLRVWSRKIKSKITAN